MKNIIFIIFILFVSCSKEKKYIVTEIDGVKVFYNKKSSTTNIGVHLKELFSIPGNPKNPNATFSNATLLAINEKEDIFILDTKSCKVIKFDKTGKFITAFGRRGLGPGETQYPSGIACINNRVYIADQSNRKIIVLDYNGKYIKTIKSKSGMPDNFIASKDSKFIGIVYGYRRDKGKEIDELKLTLYDSSFVPIKLLNQKDIIFDPNNMEDTYLAFQHYATNSKGIFVAETETNNYQIDFFSFDGNKKYSIKKGQIKIPYTETEINTMKRWISRTSNNMKINHLKNKYKYSIQALYTDCRDRVWAVNPWKGKIPDSLSFNVFQQGVFLKKVKLELPLDYYLQLPSSLYFKGNKIYVLNKTDIYLKVYSIY